MSWDTELHHFDAFLAASGRSPGTRKLRLHYLERLARDTTDPYTTTMDQLVAFMSNPDWSPETRKSARAALRTFYGWAVTSGRMTMNPAARLPPVRVPPGVPKPTPETLLERATLAATDRDKLMLMLGALAGLRAGEIASLRWTDIDDGHLRVTGKGGRVRRVPVHVRLRPVLAAEWRRREQRGVFGTGYRYGDVESPFLFPGQQAGTHITAGAVGRILKRNLAGLKGHSLRHRFATNVYAGTRDQLALQMLLGHSKPETTAIYVRIPDDALAAAVGAA